MRFAGEAITIAVLICPVIWLICPDVFIASRPRVVATGKAPERARFGPHQGNHFVDRRYSVPNKIGLLGGRHCRKPAASTAQHDANNSQRWQRQGL